MYVNWDNFHFVDGRDFDSLKTALKARLPNADVHSVQWGFRPNGRPYAIVEVGHHVVASVAKAAAEKPKTTPTASTSPKAPV